MLKVLYFIHNVYFVNVVSICLNLVTHFIPNKKRLRHSSLLRTVTSVSLVIGNKAFGIYLPDTHAVASLSKYCAVLLQRNYPYKLTSTSAHIACQLKYYFTHIYFVIKVSIGQL